MIGVAAARSLARHQACDNTHLQGGFASRQRCFSAAAAAGGSGQPGYGVQQMSVAELREVLDDEDLRDTVQLLDVREPWEAEESSLPHFTLLPLSRQQEWAGDIGEQLDPDKHTIVLCHHGMRSNMVANFLTSSLDFSNVSNVAGGIEAYAAVDASVPRY
jgi:rhodanese-related sulfurtransferase